MNCPRCAQPTNSQTVHNVEADVCPRCKGMFLDHGVLNAIAEPTAGDLEFSTLHLDTFEHDDVHVVVACPRCQSGSMQKVEFNIYTNIILDYCEGCRGFWLDGDELARIDDEVRRLNAAPQDGPEPPMLWFARFIWTLPR